MDVFALQNHIIQEPTYICTVLENLGFEHIRDRGKYIQFPNKNGDNMSACSIWKNNLHYENFSHGEKGNLFSLVMSDKGCDFPAALNQIAEWVGFKDTARQKISFPFGGFYRHLVRPTNNVQDELPEYPLSELPESDGVSLKFFQDGISYITQEHWGVRYNAESDSILIPVFSGGKLIGVKARNNDPHCDAAHRWWAYLPYSKTQTLFGLDNNYNVIQQKNTVIVFESEKSVMQCDTFGLHCAVAIGGHNISTAQAKMLKSLMVDRIILAYDEGIPEEEIKSEVEKIICQNVIYNNKIGYIYDQENAYLKRGSKDSPSDNGVEVMRHLLKNCVRWT